MRKPSRNERRRAAIKAKKEQNRRHRLESQIGPVATGQARSVSPPLRRAAWQWPDPREDKLELLRSVDGFADLRGALGRIAKRDEEWAGVPMPLDGHRLVIEPRYPHAAELAQIGAPEEEKLPEGTKIRNRWWSDRTRCTYMIWEEGGKIEWGRIAGFHGLGFALQTLGASDVWGIEQEHRALQLLGTMVRHRQFKQYLLTGMFMETSKRSGLTYLFRKLRPTVVVNNKGSEPRIVCTLCLHPIAYYEGSWAGAMCPTDDVIAHLSLMRGDEPMLWRRANQHGPTRPEAGL